MANEPTKIHRIGDLSLSVWRTPRKTKDGKEFTSFSASFSRSFQKDGKTEYTSSLQIEDLLIASALLKKAWDEEIAIM